MPVKLNLDTNKAIRMIQRLVHEEFVSLCENVTELAKDKTPYDTGTNRASITWDESEKQFRVYTQSGYGAYLELGTSKMQAKPYIYPAFEESKKDFFVGLENLI